jgi:hypothetical protein
MNKAANFMEFLEEEEFPFGYMIKPAKRMPGSQMGDLLDLFNPRGEWIGIYSNKEQAIKASWEDCEQSKKYY